MKILDCRIKGPIYPIDLTTCLDIYSTLYVNSTYITNETLKNIQCCILISHFQREAYFIVLAATTSPQDTGKAKTDWRSPDRPHDLPIPGPSVV